MRPLDFFLRIQFLIFYKWYDNHSPLDFLQFRGLFSASFKLPQLFSVSLNGTYAG